MSQTNRKQFETNLLREGIESYVDAMVALKAFQGTASSIALKVLTTNAPDLRKAMRLPNSSTNNVYKYISPDGSKGPEGKDWDGSWAWVAAQWNLNILTSTQCFLGLLFERDDDDNVNCDIALTFEGHSRQVYRIFQSALLGTEHSFENSSSRAVGFRRRLSDAINLESELNGIIEHTISKCVQFIRWDSEKGTFNLADGPTDVDSLSEV